MKSFWIILGVLAGMTPADADLAPPGNLVVVNPAQQNKPISHQSTTNAQTNFVPRDPWRAINGVTNYVKNNGVAFCGKIVEVTKDGVRMEGAFGELFKTDYNPAIRAYDQFFVAHFPYPVENGQSILGDDHLMAWHVGTYTNSTMAGGSRTMEKLDYGIPCDPLAGLVQRQSQATQATKP